MTRTDISFDTRLQRKQYFTAAKLLIADPQLQEEIFDRFLYSDLYTSQRIANVFERLKANHQSLLQPYYADWIQHLHKPPNTAFWRNSYRYFQDAEIPQEYQGKLYDLAFRDLIQPDSPIAVKAYAMKICTNMAMIYPELIPELEQAIQQVAEFGSAAVKNRANKMLLTLEKQRS